MNHENLVPAPFPRLSTVVAAALAFFAIPSPALELPKWDEDHDEKRRFPSAALFPQLPNPDSKMSEEIKSLEIRHEHFWRLAEMLVPPHTPLSRKRILQLMDLSYLKGSEDALDQTLEIMREPENESELIKAAKACGKDLVSTGGAQQ